MIEEGALDDYLIARSKQVLLIAWGKDSRKLTLDAK
jgi:hypothetical protein